MSDSDKIKQIIEDLNRIADDLADFGDQEYAKGVRSAANYIEKNYLEVLDEITY